MQMISWNDLSLLGLHERINREILHPLGLAIYRDTDTGISPGALIAPDGVFTFSDDMVSKDIMTDDEIRIFIAKLAKDGPDTQFNAVEVTP